MANSFTVIRHAKNRFEVSGVISLYRGTEAYSRIFTTKRAAEADAAKWNKAEVVAERDRIERRETRLRIAAEYIAARAARPSKTQLAFAF